MKDDEAVDLVRRRLLATGTAYVAPLVIVSLTGSPAFAQPVSCNPNCVPKANCNPNCVPKANCNPNCAPKA